MNFLGQWENRPTFSLLYTGLTVFYEKDECLVAEKRKREREREKKKVF